MSSMRIRKRKILIRMVIAFAVMIMLINTFGAQLLAGVMEKAVGAPVRVGRLHIGVFTSSLGLYHFEIHNPPGFTEKKLAEIHEISIKMDFPALLTGKIHLKRMRLDFGDITLEKNANGKVNLMELGAMKGSKSQAPAPAPGGEKPAPTETQKPQKPTKPIPIQIDEVLVNIGKVRYVDSVRQPPVLKSFDLGIKNEKISNVTDASGLVKQIVFLILRKAGLSALAGNFDAVVKEMSEKFSSAFNGFKAKYFK